ncbi:MAG: hypothetical protein JOZ80_03285 [Acidobacteriaceae bacterium]|nr:hypothetical protein [Acidobacteriaceae bacterium]
MENYFNYFTEIEEHFRLRFGGPLVRISTMDWALIEVWKDAGIPLEAVLRGIDVTFEHYDRRPSKTRKVNSLGFCAQEVLAAVEDMREAAVGSERPERPRDAGFQKSEIIAFLQRASQEIETAKLPSRPGVSITVIAEETGGTLRVLADEIQAENQLPRLEDLERRLTVVEEKLFAALLAVSSDDDLVTMRAEADRELAAYRSKMPAAQIEQLQKQYLRKRLFEKYGLPRLSLFYM